MRHIAKLSLIFFLALTAQANAQKAIELTPSQVELLKEYQEEAQDRLVRAQDRLVRAQVALRCLGYYFGTIDAESKKQRKITIGAFKLWQREAGFRSIDNDPEEERLTMLEAQAHRKTKGKCQIKD